MTAPALVGPLAGQVLDNGSTIELWVTPGHEGRIRNCLDLYLTHARNALAARPADAPNPSLVALDEPNDGPHVWAVLRCPVMVDDRLGGQMRRLPLRRGRLDGRELHQRFESAGRAICADTGLRLFWAFAVVVLIVCWIFG